MTTLVKKPESFDFFGERVYVVNDIQDYDPNFFYGCAAGVRKIIDKKNIPESEYFYGSLSKNGYKKYNSSYPKAKLLLKVDWVHQNVPKLAINANLNYDIESAPELLYLDYNEMFKDSNGKPLEIEAIGYRHTKRCYFKVKDVGKAFEMEKITRSNLIKI